MAGWFRRVADADRTVAPDPASRPKAWLDEEEDRLIPPRNLWVGRGDSISHYYRWVWEYLAYLTLLTGLQREQAVLELGCSHGRTARGLLSYLRSPGRYVGLDVHGPSIEDARARIEARYPNFHFVQAAVRNRHYNPEGRTSADCYSFPLPDASFDVVYAASLFTHLLPCETRRYFLESARVLKPGGHALFSVFLLDCYRGPGTTTSPFYQFEHPLEGCEGVAVRDPDFPDNAVAYRSDVLASCANEAGLDVVRVLPGLWTESPGFAVNEQDLVLLRRR